MKIIIGFLLLLVPIFSSFGQHLLTEKFDNCELNRFTIDGGETKAQPPQSFVDDFLSNLDQQSKKKISGEIEVQILLDSEGKPCLLSAENDSNIKSKKLKLRKAINKTQYWTPAKKGSETIKVSVLLKIEFLNGELTSIQRRNFNSNNRTNLKSVGTPNTKGSEPTKLSHTWTVFTKQNSDLPWDMARAVASDKDNDLWFGTDNGIVKMANGQMEIFDNKNTILKSEKYNADITTSIRYAEVDNQNNKWFIAGWDAYKYDGQNWILFDSLNSPINWPRKIFVDNSDDVWFTSWEGVSKYDGENWSVIDTTNSKLPSNKTLGLFVDSQDRIWIGTFDGNIRIEEEKTTTFESSNTPLEDGNISKVQEDECGNLWFSLYDKGMFKLSSGGKWETIKPKNSDIFAQNNINDFLLDEVNQKLWIALNSVGLILYDITNDDWEIYTPENSEVPSIHVMQLTKDQSGTIWAATFAGIIKMNE